MKKKAFRKDKFKMAPPARAIRSGRPGSALAGMVLIFFLATATFAAPYLLASSDKKGDKGKSLESLQSWKGFSSAGLTENDAILHATNRLGFGPRPADLERVKEMGLQKW